MAAKIELKERWRDLDVSLADKKLGMLRFHGGDACETYACVPEALRTENEDSRADSSDTFFLDWDDCATKGVQRIFRRHGMQISRKEAIDATRRIKSPIK